MSDERGGRYYREARFFLAGDRPRAQLHTSEARMLMGEMRDSLAMGGPPIQIRYTQLQDGTTIKAVMMNGQYQAGIFSPILKKRGGKRRVVRYAQVCVQVDPATNIQQRIGMTFNTSGPMFGDVPGTYPETLFGTDLTGYVTRPNYVTYDEYVATAGLDRRSPTGEDDFSCGIGRRNWWSAPGKPVITCGRAMGDDVIYITDTLGESVLEHVFQDGRTIATPGTGQYEAVLGAAVYTLPNGDQKLVVAQVISGRNHSEVSLDTRPTVAIKVADYVNSPTYYVGSGSFTTIGTYYFSVDYGTTDWKIPFYSFSTDGSKAVGVYYGRGVSTVSINADCTVATFAYDLTLSQPITTVSGVTDYKFVMDVAYAPDNETLRVLRCVYHSETVITYTYPATTNCVGKPSGTWISWDGYDITTQFDSTMQYERIDDGVTTVVGHCECSNTAVESKRVILECGTPGPHEITTTTYSTSGATTHTNMPVATDLRYDAYLVETGTVTLENSREYYYDTEYAFGAGPNHDVSSSTTNYALHLRMLNEPVGADKLEFDEIRTETSSSYSDLPVELYARYYFELANPITDAQYRFQAVTGVFVDEAHFALMVQLPTGTVYNVWRDGGGFKTVPIVELFPKLVGGDYQRTGAAIGLVSVRDEETDEEQT
jgi:hypothetical protein